MAEKIKHDSNSLISRAPEVLKRIEDVTRYKEEAREINGRAGQATKDIVENLHVNRWAVTQFSALIKKEPIEQQSRLFDLLVLVLESDVLNQIDAFDEKFHHIAQRFAEIADGAATGGQGEDSTVLSLVNDTAAE